MEFILREPIQKYLIQKSKDFKGNELASKFRNDFPEELSKILADKSRYVVSGSAGKGRWTDCPWVAVLDHLITDTPQKGYYPVFIFKADMSGVYLSLNQGITEVRENYRKDAKSVLKLRAEDFRAKLKYKASEFVTLINLSSKTSNAKHYEAGNILAKFYSKDNLPTSQELRSDTIQFLGFYETLAYYDGTFADESDNGDYESKQLRLHWRIERRKSIAKKVKKIKGHKCEACEMTFIEKYGEIGKNFIEAHHLVPISSLEIGKFKIDVKNDFAVLCANCHRMIHRMEDPSDIIGLKKLINEQ